MRLIKSPCDKTFFIIFTYFTAMSPKIPQISAVFNKFVCLFFSHDRRKISLTKLSTTNNS